MTDVMNVVFIDLTKCTVTAMTRHKLSTDTEGLKTVTNNEQKIHRLVRSNRKESF